MLCSTFLGTALFYLNILFKYFIINSLLDLFLVNADWSRCSNSKDFPIEIQVLLHIKTDVSGQYVNKLPSLLSNLYHNYLICRGNNACHYEEVIISYSSQSALYHCSNILAANGCKKLLWKILLNPGENPGKYELKNKLGRKIYSQIHLWTPLVCFLNETMLLSNNYSQGETQQILFNQL